MDVELSRVELELQQEESALHSELTRLMAVGVELDRRLKALRSTAAQAADEGVRDAGLDGRLRASIVPEVDADAPFLKARSAREAAVKARREANVSIRSQIAQVKTQLTQVSQQVTSDEKAAQRLMGLVKQKQREAAEAAEAEADAFAGDKTLPPGSMSAVVLPPPPAPTPPPPPPPPGLPAAKRQRSPTRPPLTPKADSGAVQNRFSPRVRMQAAVDLHSDNNFFTGFSSNLSDGGLFVATVNLVPIGTEVDLTFSLPSGQKIAAKGTVRWVREVNDKLPDSFPGLGIQFAGLDDHAQAAIDDFLADREPLFYAD